MSEPSGDKRVLAQASDTAVPPRIPASAELFPRLGYIDLPVAAAFHATGEQCRRDVRRACVSSAATRRAPYRRPPPGPDLVGNAQLRRAKCRGNLDRRPAGNLSRERNLDRFR
jgi:hypothetical protein